MTWSNERRAFFFGCECSPQLTAAEINATGCLTGHLADDAFRKRYCAPNRRLRPKNRLITGTEPRLHGVPIPVARCVISKLAELVPGAHHATPGWDWSNDALPAVVIGRLDGGFKIQTPRCGLWAHDGKLYFWAEQVLFQRFNLSAGGWEAYGPTDKAGRFLRYGDPLSCQCEAGGPNALPSAVVTLLKAFAKAPQFANADRDSLAPREVGEQSVPGRAAIRVSDMPSSVIGVNKPTKALPQKAKRKIDRSSEESLPEATAEENSDGSDDEDAAEQEKVVSCDHMGMVFEDASGAISVYVDTRDCFQANWLRNISNDQTRVLFVCCGPNIAGVQAIVDQIRVVKQHLNAGIIPTPPHAVGAPQGPVGSTYVYGYFDPTFPPAWNSAFYIGVGTVGKNDRAFGGRWTNHIGDARKGCTAPRHIRINAWHSVNSITKNLERESGVRSELVRKIYAFRGPHAEELKFYTEQFLISHGFGAYNLDNDTNGNSKSGGYRGVSRPYVFQPHVPQHVYCWIQLVNAFVADPNNPQLGNTLIPALLTLVATSFLGALDTALGVIGLTPIHGVPEGRLASGAILAKNLNVTGASDCMISYLVPGRHYRIDLRLRKNRPSLIINMRPLVNAKLQNENFNHYLRGHAIPGGNLHGINLRTGPLLGIYSGNPIRNANQWPFYKPMVFNANGRVLVEFPMDWPPAAPLAFPTIRIKLPNWLDPSGGMADMNLIQALELVLLAFP